MYTCMHITVIPCISDVVLMLEESFTGSSDIPTKMQNLKTQANLAENGRGRSAPAQFWPGVGKATRLG